MATAAAKGMKRTTGLLLILRPLSTRYAMPIPAQTRDDHDCYGAQGCFHGAIVPARCIPAPAVRIKMSSPSLLRPTYMSDCGCDPGEAAHLERRTLLTLLAINGHDVRVEAVAGWFAEVDGSGG